MQVKFPVRKELMTQSPNDLYSFYTVFISCNTNFLIEQT